MKYLRRSFTLPASSGKTTEQKQWDLAFLSPEEFTEKYGEEPGDFISQVVRQSTDQEY